MHNRKNLMGGGSSSSFDRLTKILLCLFFVLSFVFTNIEPSYAISLKQISVKKHFANSSAFQLNKTKLNSITWNLSAHKTEVKNGKTYYAVKIGVYAKAATYTGNICTLHFKNVGTIGGKQINCDVTFSNFHTDTLTRKNKGEQKDGYIGIFDIPNSSESIQTGVATQSSKFGYQTSKYIDYTMKFMYTDGTVINLPFAVMVSDMDASHSYYREGWAALSGFSGNYWKYANKTSSGTALNSYTLNGKTYSPYPLAWSASGNNYTVKAPAYSNTQYLTNGDQMYYCSGFYAETTGGMFKNRYYFGNCASMVTVYNQYASTMTTTPKKTVDKITVDPGEELIYTITHKMGLLYETVLSPYKTLEFEDNLPNEFSYVDVHIYNGNATDITSSAGTLTYDENSNTVKYAFNSAWVSNTTNYNGQNISMKIKVKAKPVEAVSTKTKNQATIFVENKKVTLPSTNVDVEIVNSPKLQIVKKVKKDDIVAPHGNETFIFKIKSKNTGREWYRNVTFANTDNSSDRYWTFSEDDEYKIATGKVEEFPIRDEYDISEISVSRYKEVSKDAKEDGRTYIYTFDNAKDNWQYYSHNNIIINTLLQK